jgi:alpha-tubulin suppressor-like RCC1 family protein
VEIEAGAHHSLVLTNDGRVYSFGLAQHGQLGTCPPPQPRWSRVWSDQLACCIVARPWQRLA